jgi:two-component system chemotaxis response regulator CheB
MTIKVLIVDDSAFMRKMISEIISSQPDLEVAGTARNGRDALRKLEQLEVDVVTLDVEMPVLDGIETLRAIMNEKPMPVVMLSTRTKKGSETTIQALSLGAVDFIAKPSGPISLDIDKIAEEIVEKIRLAATARFAKKERPDTLVLKPKPRSFPKPPTEAAETLVIIGSSTGGPRAVETVLSDIPPNLPAGIVVVQHMPKDFTRSFAERLNSLFPVPVKEAENGDLVRNGQVLVAPGDYHLRINSERRIILSQEERVMFLRPAIDITMETLPEVFKTKIVGVILTGMGRDGARGMAIIKQAGGVTIAQDKSTSTIYSMPRVVAEEGNADYILPLNQIGGVITDLVASMQ